jgi:capsular polysaccharide biosynthesis protein
MDLLSLTQALWRHKLAALPVIVLIVLAALYILKIEPPVYQASSSILLTNPPPAATKSQIEADPKLRRADPFNTFSNYGNLSIVAQAVIDNVTSKSSMSALAALGVDKRYQVTLSIATDEPTAPPIIDITSFGATTQQAIQGDNLLTAAVRANLYQLQDSAGINPFYMIKAVEIVEPYQPQLSISGKLRSLAAVLGMGVILFLLVVSVADAMGKRRAAARSQAGTRRMTTRDDGTDLRELGREAVRLNHGPDHSVARRY